MILKIYEKDVRFFRNSLLGEITFYFLTMLTDAIDFKRHEKI